MTSPPFTTSPRIAQLIQKRPDRQPVILPITPPPLRREIVIIARFPRRHPLPQHIPVPTHPRLPLARITMKPRLEQRVVRLAHKMLPQHAAAAY